MPFSQEFRVPGAAGYGKHYAAAVFDSQLWLIGPGALAPFMFQTTLQLVHKTTGNPLQIDTEVTEAANWTTSEQVIPGVKGPATYSRCGAAPVGDALHLVWNSVGEGSTLRASRYTVGADGQPAWQPAVTLVPHGDPQGRLVAGSRAEVSVTGFGQDTLIVACPNVHSWWAPGSPTTIYLGTFKVDEIDEQHGTWRAHSDIWGGGPTTPPMPPFGPGYAFPRFLDSISIDWFTAPSQSGPSDEPAVRPPSSYLWVPLYLSEGLTPSVVPLHVDPTTGTVDIDYAHRLSGKSVLQWGPMTVVRDPAGGVRLYYADTPERAVGVSELTTFIPPETGDRFLLPEAQNWIQTGGLSDVAPTAAFVTQFETPTQAKYTYKDGNKTTTYTGTEYPVYEFVFYGVEHLSCQVDRFGTAQVFPDLYLGHANPKNSETIIVSGIIDGPIPVPAINLANEKQLPDTFGTVTYSTVETVATEHRVSNSWTAGFMSSGESLKGFGPAWDISISGGMGYVKTDGTTTSTTDAKQELARLDTAASPPNLIPAGTAFGAAAKFLWTAYRFLDADGDPVADGFDATTLVPHFTTVSCSFDPDGARSYVPYAVKPGDLASYTPEAWDARMKALGFDGNYFEEIIDKNAYKFSDTQNYLTASWTATGGSIQNFEAATTQFTETSWTVDSEVYAGISGGEGATIFGIGAEESFKFLVGGTYSHEASKSTEEEKAWGIGLSDEFGPVPSENAKAIAEYTFRIYFLPVPPVDGPLPPNYWVQELKKSAEKAATTFSGSLPFQSLDPNTIDGNACAWKIVFVVTHYKSVDGKTEYNYTGPLA